MAAGQEGISTSKRKLGVTNDLENNGRIAAFDERTIGVVFLLIDRRRNHNQTQIFIGNLLYLSESKAESKEFCRGFEPPSLAVKSHKPDCGVTALNQGSARWQNRFLSDRKPFQRIQFNDILEFVPSGMKYRGSPEWFESAASRKVNRRIVFDFVKPAVNQAVVAFLFIIAAFLVILILSFTRKVSGDDARSRSEVAGKIKHQRPAYRDRISRLDSRESAACCTGGQADSKDHTVNAPGCRTQSAIAIKPRVAIV